MYRNCIFCSAALGANEALERFPVGRTLAFDGEKGRLWAVCRKCARWNLAPLEERWEAIEDAERLFRDTRLRAQSENIGVAGLPDGTRLIRVGTALPGELAAWRYGESLVQRRRRHALIAGASVAAVGTIYLAGVVTGGISITVANLLVNGGNVARAHLAGRGVLGRFAAEGTPATLRWREVQGAAVQLDEDGGLAVQLMRRHRAWMGRGWQEPEAEPARFQGPEALRLLARAMPRVNARGARRDAVNHAVRILEATSPQGYVQASAKVGFLLSPAVRSPVERLAFEMALHEEAERRAMEGELAALEMMWREAEQIADIADRLPDVAPPDPPRLTG